MEKYKNSELPLEERLSDLLSKMTLEEMIMQTDQYYSHDFTTLDEAGDAIELDMYRQHTAPGHDCGPD